jgi:hypothetical protein
MMCQREGCNRPVPPGRRKYCSVECSKIVNRRSAAERSKLRAQAYRRERMVKYAPRICLACQSTFMSEGPWNRICGQCSDRNDTVCYSRARGNSLGTPDDEFLLVEAEIDSEQPSAF